TQAGDQGYSYDANGNPTNDGDVIGTDNQLTSNGTWNYSYDAVGNLTGKTATDSSGIAWTYGYDYANHLISAVETQNGTTVLSISYSYDCFGNRVSRTFTDGSGTTTTLFSYDESGALYAEENGSGTITTRYVSGISTNVWLARIDGDGGAWLLSDHQGSVT